MFSLLQFSLSLFTFLCECLGLNLSVKSYTLINLHKWIIRKVSRRSFDEHANPIFVSLRILKFEDIIKIQIGKYMQLYRNGLLLNSFNDMFIL